MTMTEMHEESSFRREPAPLGRCEEVSFPSGERLLTGYLWVPPGPGPFRTIVFNHGCERDPDEGAMLARFFNLQGFVLFVPFRRGHGKSPGPYIGDVRDQTSRGDKARIVLEELEAQVDDVVASLAYLQTRPEVRRDAIAVIGNSFGGVQALLAAERETSFKCAVDFTGGAVMWNRSAPLRRRMIEAASRATIPVLFIQPETELSTAPTRMLVAEMARCQKPWAAWIYPASGMTARHGHRICRRSIAAWGRDVLAWLDRTMP
jgi:dienelactone hydrolase